MKPITTTRLGSKIHKYSSIKQIELGKKHPMRKLMGIKQIVTDKDAKLFKIHLGGKDDYSNVYCNIVGKIKDMKAVFAWIRDLKKTYKHRADSIVELVTIGVDLDEKLAKRLSKSGSIRQQFFD